MGKIADEIKSFDSSLRADEVSLGNLGVTAENLDLSQVAPKIREIVQSKEFYFKNNCNTDGYYVAGVYVYHDSQYVCGWSSIIRFNQRQSIGAVSTKDIGKWRIEIRYTTGSIGSTPTFEKDFTFEMFKNYNTISFNGLNSLTFINT